MWYGLVANVGISPFKFPLPGLMMLKYKSMVRIAGTGGHTMNETANLNYLFRRCKMLVAHQLHNGHYYTQCS